MAEPAIKGAGISVGAADYKDRNLCQCPAAGASAAEVASALDAKLVRRVRVVTNPPDFDALFGEITKAARDAKGGTFFFYFAGHALRRGDDLLLAVSHSELEGSKGCVPLSDVLDIIRRAQVQSSLVILNIDQPPAAKGPSLGEGVTVIGSSRSYDARTADVRFREFAGAVVAALRAPALELEPYLEDGLFNSDGLARYLADKAPKAVKPEVFAAARERLVLRNLAEDLAAAKAAAEKAAVEKAAAEKAAAEKAAADKAAAEKAAKEAAEKAAAEKKAAEEAAEKAAAEKKAAEEAAEEAAAEKKAAEEAAEKAAAEKPATVAEATEKKAVKKAIQPAAKAKLAAAPDEAQALAKEPPPSNLAYYIVAVLIIAALVYYFVIRPSG